MTIETLEAWVLHKRLAGDTSVQVTFFTREKGILQALYKGGRSPKKQASLQPFAPLWLGINVWQDWHYVRHVEATEGACELKGNSLFAGLYVNELLYYALRPMDVLPELFDAYLQLMQDLPIISDRLAIEVLLRRFEWSLLLASGYSISCVEELGSSNPIKANQYYHFIAGEGFIAADEGISGRDILALGQGDLGKIEVLKAAKLIMRQAIDYLLGGRELKSRTYMKNLARKSQGE
jgi:DNA repair protein RecO (recombination protein O)